MVQTRDTFALRSTHNILPIRKAAFKNNGKDSPKRGKMIHACGLASNGISDTAMKKALLPALTAKRTLLT